MVVHTFNPRALKAEDGESLSLRQACSTEGVPGQPSLDSEGTIKNQKADKNILEQGAVVQPQQQQNLAALTT